MSKEIKEEQLEIYKKSEYKKVVGDHKKEVGAGVGVVGGVIAGAVYVALPPVAIGAGIGLVGGIVIGKFIPKTE